jgi:hypothetical protein
MVIQFAPRFKRGFLNLAGTAKHVPGVWEMNNSDWEIRFLLIGNFNSFHRGPLTLSRMHSRGRLCHTFQLGHAQTYFAAIGSAKTNRCPFKSITSNSNIP